jgi:hypothetical protein
MRCALTQDTYYLLLQRDLERTISTLEQQIILAYDRRTSRGMTWNRPSETTPLYIGKCIEDELYDFAKQCSYEQ